MVEEKSALLVLIKTGTAADEMMDKLPTSK